MEKKLEGKNKRKIFYSLNSFRGIAAISIVMFHLRVVNSITELNYIRSSYLFVEFFFILSGFMLVHSNLKKKHINVKEFIIKRTFRIFPLYLTTIAILLGLEGLKFILYKRGLSLGQMPFTGEMSLTQLLPNLLLLQSWIPPFHLGYNYPSWYLSIEFYIAIVFIFTFLMSKRYRNVLWLILSVTLG